MPGRIPCLTVTSAVDLGLVDPIHIDALGLHHLGRRMARQAMALTAGDAARLGPSVVRVESLPTAEVQGAVRVVCAGVEGWRLPAEHTDGLLSPMPAMPLQIPAVDGDFFLTLDLGRQTSGRPPATC